MRGMHIVLIVILILGLAAVCMSLIFDPHSVTAVGTVTLTVATLLLVTVAFFDIHESHKQVQEQIDESRKQAQETQHAQLRPLLIPRGLLPTEPTETWPADADGLYLDVQNVGSGVAVNVCGLLLSSTESGPRPNKFYLRFDLPMAPNEPVKRWLKRGTHLSRELTIGNEGDKVPLGCPDTPTCKARLTLSYRDILGYRHASIFDLTTDGVNSIWQHEHTLKEIPHDLAEISKQEGKNLTERFTNLHAS